MSYHSDMARLDSLKEYNQEDPSCSQRLAERLLGTRRRTSCEDCLTLRPFDRHDYCKLWPDSDDQGRACKASKLVQLVGSQWERWLG